MNNEQLLEGYKQTEIGVIPEDWEAPKLEQMTNLIIDGTHLTPQYTNYGIPFLRVTDLQSSTIDLESLKFISNQEPRRKRTGYRSRFAPEPQIRIASPRASPQSSGEYVPYSIQ